MQLVDTWRIDRLDLAGWPADDQPVHACRCAEPVVDTALVLRAEPASALDFLRLHAAVPVQLDACSDCARLPFEFDVDPVPSWLHGVEIDQQRSALVGDDDVEHATVLQI